MAHTPGPFEVRRAKVSTDGGYDYAVGAKIDGNTHCIAEMFEVVARGVRVDAEANARLFAAAPETAAERDKLLADNRALTEALERASVRMESAARVYTAEPDHTQWSEWSKSARQTIAKHGR